MRGTTKREDAVQPLLLSMPDTRKTLGDVSSTTVWRLVKAGHIETVKIGQRTFAKAETVYRVAAQGAATARPDSS